MFIFLAFTLNIDLISIENACSNMIGRSGYNTEHWCNPTWTRKSLTESFFQSQLWSFLYSDCTNLTNQIYT